MPPSLQSGHRQDQSSCYPLLTQRSFHENLAQTLPDCSALYLIHKITLSVMYCIWDQKNVLRRVFS